MLKKLFGVKSGSEKTRGTFGSNELAPAVRDAISAAVGQRAIPVMPGAAQKAFALSSNPKAEARDFIEVIEVDEALAARVIKIANSVFFERGKKSNTIEDAVLVIGLNELKNLLNANALSDIFPSSNPARVGLWAHDVAVAMTAKQLAAKLLPSQAENAFLAGLMHDIGKLLLLQRCTTDYIKALELVEQKGLDFIEAEEQVFPFDHTQVGQMIAEKWNFSAELISVISLHHDPRIAAVNDSPISLPKLVACADGVVHSLGLGMTPKFHKLRTKNQERLSNLWEQLGMPESEAKNFLSQAKRSFESEYDLYSGSFGK